MIITNLTRKLEILSVGPTYFRCLVGKQIYLNRAAKSPSNVSSQSSQFLRANINEIGRNYLGSTAALLSGDKISPGGFYTGTWCRDASYILNELLEMREHELVGRWLEWIWNHSINDSNNIIHGRGSPEFGYKSRAAKADFRNLFSGLLPSSVQHGYIEVYGKNPDIDSTSLMISVTCRFCSEAIGTPLCEKLVKHIERAISSMGKRDLDGDHLLEQGPNEDWMDTMLRSGRVVYSQAAWGMAILDWSELLQKLGRSLDAEKARLKVREIIIAINDTSWNDNAKSYSDSPNGYNEYRLDSDRIYATLITSKENATDRDNQHTWLTQDAVLFLLLLDSFNKRDYQYSDGVHGVIEVRARGFLQTLKERAWNGLGSSCVNPPTSVTGPFKWGANKYQNAGFWPWITSIEILARFRYDASDENAWDLLGKTLRYSHVEWISPLGDRSGAYPFRTSIAAVRSLVRKATRHSTGK